MVERHTAEIKQLSATKFDEQYHAVNLGLHRRTASRFGTPALVWHRYYWIPDDLDVEVWHEQIGRFLSKFFLGLQELKHLYKESELTCPNYDGSNLYTFQRFWNLGAIESVKGARELRGKNLESEPVDQQHRSSLQNVFACDLLIPDVKFLFRATLQTEYWTTELIADFSRSESVTNERFPELCKAFDALSASMANVTERYNQRPTARKTSRANLEKLTDTVTAAVDSDIVLGYKNFCRRILLERADISEDDSCYAGVLNGKVFGDFVGIVFGLNAVGEAQSTERNGHKVRPLLAPVSYGGPGQRVAIPDRNPNQASLTNSEASRLLDAMWPFIKKVQRASRTQRGNRSEYATTKPEYTASLFQRGQFLYVSALGRSVAADNVAACEEPYPAVYTAVCVHSNRWQLGRVIDKIHEIGALRLAAVRDFDRILEAGRSLNDAREKISSANPDIRAIKDTLDKIEVGTGRRDGLQNRLERGRYYIERFRKLAESLEVQRIEGFQPYPQFVERRLADKFSTVEYVGRIYHQTGKAFRSLTNIELQNTISKQIDGTTDLLEAAEKISVIPLTYYLGSMIVHICDKIPVFERFYVESRLGTFAVSAVAVLSFVYVLNRGRKQRNAKKLRLLNG
jgi:hypothetical protein